MKSLLASKPRKGLSAMTGGGGGRSLASQYAFSTDLKYDLTVQRGTGPLSFTRATAQTYINGAGDLASVGAGIPAFASDVPQPTATNIFPYSNDFSTSWTLTAVAAKNAVGINGLANSAWTLTDDSAVADKSVSRVMGAELTGGVWTFSLYIKKTIGPQSYYPTMLVFLASTVSTGGCTIDTTNGVATPWTAYTGNTLVPCTTFVESVGDFWRVSLTSTVTASAWQYRFDCAGRVSATSATGVNDATLLGSQIVQNFQLEAGPVATGYIDTLSAPVTRDATSITSTKGIYLEPTSTNLFLNSATGVTQNVTTTAIPYTLSFFGTGTITKSGTSTGALVGTGVKVRVSQTFTPTAGTLTLTVTGSCTDVQIEALPILTSPILTAGAAATRNATVVTGPLTANLPTGTKHISLYFSTAGYLVGTKQVLWSSRTDASNEVSIWHNGAIVVLEKKVAGVSEYVTYTLTPVVGTSYLVDAYIYADNTMGLAVNGVLQTGTLGVELLTTAQQQCDSGFTINDASVTVDGKINFIASATNKGVVAVAVLGTASPKIWSITATANITSGGLKAYLGNTFVNMSVGTNTYAFIKDTTASASVSFYANIANTTADIDNTSVKEVLNNSTTLAPVFASTFEVGSSASLNQLNGNLNSLKFFGR